MQTNACGLAHILQSPSQIKLSWCYSMLNTPWIALLPAWWCGSMIGPVMTMWCGSTVVLAKGSACSFSSYICSSNPPFRSPPMKVDDCEMQGLGWQRRWQPNIGAALAGPIIPQNLGCSYRSLYLIYSCWKERETWSAAFGPGHPSPLEKLQMLLQHLARPIVANSPQGPTIQPTPISGSVSGSAGSGGSEQCGALAFSGKYGFITGQSHFP